jgi:tRNA(Ile)-lysidine synthase TilS/MesJ
MLRFSSSANGARVLKLSRSKAQFLSTASTTMSTNSTVAMRVARGSKARAQAPQRWRAHMPALTGRPSTMATWPIIRPTGTSTARAAPR